jgi:ubiquinone/menaquinone biosynthesis C-methylase UbiE
MDEVSAFNQSQWDELAGKGIEFARPFLDLTPAVARAVVDPHGLLGDLAGKDVLCLASGGGQQSAAFHVLGARVDVFDLSAAMLERDRLVAQHYQAKIGVHQGDMRDLSRFAAASFDVVWQAYSINFIPDPRPVFEEVTRVLRPGGFYHLDFHNPYLAALQETSWTGSGYLLNDPYVDGAELQAPPWEFEDEQGVVQTLPGPREFRHSLSTILNELVGRGYLVLGLWEEVGQNAQAEPGSWEHYLRVAPLMLTLWLVYRPGLVDTRLKPK